MHQTNSRGREKINHENENKQNLTPKTSILSVDCVKFGAHKIHDSEH